MILAAPTAALAIRSKQLSVITVQTGLNGMIYFSNAMCRARLTTTIILQLGLVSHALIDVKRVTKKHQPFNMCANIVPGALLVMTALDPTAPRVNTLLRTISA